MNTGWFPVAGYERLYEVSISGSVRNSRTKRLLSPVGKQYALSRDGVPALMRHADILATSLPTDLATCVSEYEFSTEKCFKPYSSSNAVGLAGEYLVCFELTRRGVLACNNIIASAGYDVIGDYGRGRLIKIQVKTVSAPASKDAYPAPEKWYKFKGLASAIACCDVFAFVALDIGGVVFERVATHHGGDNRGFSINSFKARMGRSIDEVLMSFYTGSDYLSKVKEVQE
jgi:hypothetical protein